MKSLKKTLRESRLKAHDMMRAWLKPKIQAVGTKYRLAARIRLANSWAAKHPKRTAACTVGVLAAVLVLNIALDGKKEPDIPKTGMIADMQPVFSGFRTIQVNKDIHRRTLEELTAKGQEIRRELDSMIAIPVKSHADSMNIVERYRQLENIVKFIKDSGKHD